ncbi:MAG TPA: hypothetical protein ENN84_03175 [Candidatus Marinimicrobia bacterium]|nr:hypothetical protein [Candidatus Neomarinimicrobiota bacterium]
MIKKTIIILTIFSAWLRAYEFKLMPEPQALTIEWRLDEDEIIALEAGGEFPNPEGFIQTVINGYQAPLFAEFIKQSAGEKLHILNEEKRGVSLGKTLQSVIERDSEGKEAPALNSQREQFISLERKENNLLALHFTPLIPKSPNQAELLVSTKLRLTWTIAPQDKKSAAAKTTRNEHLPDQFVTVYINEPGFYRISASELKKAGAAVGQIFPQQIKVYRWQREIPVQVSTRQPQRFQDDDYIGVWIDSLANPYGSYRYNPFASDEALIITWDAGNGLRYAEESGALGGKVDYTPNWFDAEIHFEKEESWQKLGGLNTDQLTHVSDHWFFNQQIISGRSAVFSFDLYHPENSMRNVRFNINLQGITYSSTTEKVLTYLVNGVFMGNQSWLVRNEAISFENDNFNFNHSQLKSGKNELQIVLSGDPTIDQYYDMVLLNYAKINYDRKYIAQDDFLEFHAPSEMGDGSYLFELHGFSKPSVTIIKNNFSWIRDNLVYYNTKFNAYTLLFQDVLPAEKIKFAAISENAYLSPDTLLYTDNTRQIVEKKQGDYIIIGAEQFREASAEFLIHKEKMGFTPVYYSLEQLYHSYSNGNITPYALKEFLQEAWWQWSQKPRYVLLVGDALYNGRQTIRDLHYIPTVFVQTYRWGAAVTDHWFGDLDDDLIPEITVGRLPIRDKEQLDISYQKIIRYETNHTVDHWLNRVTLIAGYEDEFKNQTESLINTQLPETIQIDRLYINPSAQTGPYYGTTQTLAEMINDGKMLVNFLGHGGGAVWADRGLFSLDDVELLTNETKPTMVSSFTCFTATFETERGLGEMMMRSPGGAINFFGSSGLGWVINDYLLMLPTFRGLFEKKLSFGEAVNYGKTLYYATTPYNTHRATMIYQYNILGDPSVQPPYNFDKEHLSITPQDPTPGESIEISYNTNLPQGYLDLTYEGSSDKKSPVQQKIPLQLINGKLSATIDSIPSAPGDAIIFAWDPASRITKVAHNRFTPGKSFIGSPEWHPSQPALGGSASIQLRIVDSDNIQKAIILIGSDTLQLNNVSPELYRTQQTIAVASKNGISFRVEVTDGRNIKTLSPTFTLKAIEEADLALQNVSLQNGALQLTIYSGTSEPLPITLKMKDGSQSVTDQFTVIQGNRNYQRKLLPEYGSRNVTIVIESQNLTESDTSNNRWSGTLDNHWLRIDSEARALSLKHSLVEKITFYPGEKPLLAEIRSDSLPANLRPDYLALESSDALLIQFLEKPGRYALQMKSEAKEGAFPFWLRSEADAGWRLPSEGSSPQISESGWIFAASSKESVPPQMEINVNARRFLNESYVSRWSDFSVIVRDDNGVHPHQPWWDILIDGNSLNPDIITARSSKSNQEFHLRFRPELSPGEHTIQIIASDALGNRDSTDTHKMIVASDAQIIDYGNFPNPFQSRTTLIYELTEQFDEVEIDIYTLDGQRVFTINSFNAATDLPLNEVGYHEVTWRGIDYNNDFVANGVYFYAISAKRDAHLMRQRGKMVKLR